MDDRVSVGTAAAETTWALRQEVLRPGRAVRDCIYPGEADPRAAHVAAVSSDTGAVVAVGVVMPEPPPWDSNKGDGWRVRGMATRPGARGRGLGGRVLDLLLAHVAAHGGGLVWCNARTPALHLYERAGFLPRGDVFDLPEIGPHQVMWSTVAPLREPAVPDGPASP
ncbi:MAG TPA: GNAT family N-acetyltransferase [Acidimicrobiales bacterium]|nr:GNAT family N-acetyltransferase [Acidimicrobiales bacterium]